ncbi:DUF6400 family protein [Streptomyces sp. NPDC048448]|uniref:DUF6400 family protein n=1 Tax=Streptomyces kaempferi TaxID=333725 RepID=A0ABW3XUP7_9ACTN|nr:MULTISPECIES: DUF6400 family protein [unclassified Streptomyces]QIY60915.1 hypothetical protein HEP85_03410 [Streptomyces sp. RPA4-2]
MASHNPPLPHGPDEAAGRPTPEAGRSQNPELVDFAVDLTSQEVLRQAHVLDALGADWSPVEALRGEEAAYDLLYSGLDEEQRRVYDELVAAGVLPRRGDGHAAA